VRKLYRVTTGNACFGIVVQDEKVIETAPIGKILRNMYLEEIPTKYEMEFVKDLDGNSPEPLGQTEFEK